MASPGLLPTTRRCGCRPESTRSKPRPLGWAGGFSEEDKRRLCVGTNSDWSHPTTPALIESRLEPYGDLTEAEAKSALEEQARALVEAGADAIIIETQTALEELEIAIAAAREAGAPVVIGSLAYDKMADEDEVRTMMGVSPEMAAEFMAEREVDILALNCGTGVDVAMATDVVRRYRRVSGRPIMAQPNAGQPVLENFKVVYHETPEQMARDLPGLVRAGASIVGGCCGSTPAHIRRFRQVLDGGAR